MLPVLQILGDVDWQMKKYWQRRELQTLRFGSREVIPTDPCV